MGKTVSFFMFLLALTCGASGGTYKEVTHYQYVTEWTRTYCLYPPKGATCLSGLPDIFIMHGIWPADSGGEPVDKCATGSLSSDLMKKFESELTRVWPSIFKGRSPFAFWGHEYAKHGICLEKWTGLTFLSFAMKVAVNNNVTTILQKNGVVKSKVTKYSRNEIQRAIQTRIGNGLNVYLSCRELSQSLFYLREVTICIKKIQNPEVVTNYEFQSCPLNTYRSNCGGNNPEEKDIMLPTSA